jgi:adenosine deaminase
MKKIFSFLSILIAIGSYAQTTKPVNQVNVFNKIEDHTANKIYNAGVSMSINTDARTISNVTLADEYKLLERIFNWNKEHFRKCNLEAIHHSFATPDVKQNVRKIIEAAYA